MCSVLRIINKFVILGSHIIFLIINFSLFIVKLRKAETGYSQFYYIFFNPVAVIMLAIMV